MSLCNTFCMTLCNQNEKEFVNGFSILQSENRFFKLVDSFFEQYVNLFVPNAPFCHPFADVFRGQRKSALGTNGLIRTLVTCLSDVSYMQKDAIPPTTECESLSVLTLTVNWHSIPFTHLVQSLNTVFLIFLSEEELYFWECHKMFREDDQRIFLQISKPLANSALFSHVSQRQDVCEMFLL